MNNQNVETAKLAVKFFERLDFKGAELSAVVAVNNFLASIIEGKLVVSPPDNKSDDVNPMFPPKVVD